MQSSRSDERRRLDRVVTNRRMDFLFSQRNEAVPQQRAAILDMSLLGVRVRTIGTLIPGQSITLLPIAHALHSFPCRVVWVRSSSFEVYSEAGLEFCAGVKCSH